MQAKDALRVIAKTSGGNRSLSRKMGKNSNYINVNISRGSVPRVDTFANIANAAGYDLLLRHQETGNEIPIDPPLRE